MSLLKCYVLTIHCSKLAIQCCVISGIDRIMLRVTDSSFLSSYDSKEIALNCGNMLRDCIKFPYLQSKTFNLFFLVFFVFVFSFFPNCCALNDPAKLVQICECAPYLFIH